MPRDVLDVTCKFMRDPIRILVKKEELTLEGIKQFFVLVEKEVSCHCLGVLHNFGNSLHLHPRNCFGSTTFWLFCVCIALLLGHFEWKK